MFKSKMLLICILGGVREHYVILIWRMTGRRSIHTVVWGITLVCENHQWWRKIYWEKFLQPKNIKSLLEIACSAEPDSIVCPRFISNNLVGKSDVPRCGYKVDR